jgi:hypothetical protein
LFDSAEDVVIDLAMESYFEKFFGRDLTKSDMMDRTTAMTHSTKSKIRNPKS